MSGKLIIFGQPDFNEEGPTLTESKPDFTELRGHGGLGLGNWNDETISFKIQSGRWQFFENVDYQNIMGISDRHPEGIYGPGDYEDVRNYNMKKNALSSVRLVE